MVDYDRPGRPSLQERLRLIVVTDRALASPRAVTDVVEAVLEAGAPAIQLRDKHLPAVDLLSQAESLRVLCDRYGALFFVNDRVDVALAAAADGVHLGPDDLPVASTRRIVPDTFLIGYSTDDPEAARRAENEGADYIGCGTVWTTDSKSDAGTAIGPEGVRAVASAVSIPVVAIGGITASNASMVPVDAAGAAVISAVTGSPDPGGATRRLLHAVARRT
jgi:thiamine-phosphate pyrophosphorylase